MYRGPVLLLAVLVLIAISVGTGFYLYRYTTADNRDMTTASVPPPPEASPPTEQDGVIGSSRPGFSLPDLDGRERHVSEWDGEVIVVNFWATWCPPCLKEIPEFIDLQSEYGDRGLQIIGIALQKPADVVDFVREKGMNYTVLAGEMAVIQVAEDYGNNLGALPYSAVINREGRIVYTKHGQISGKKIESVIRALL